MRAQVAPPTSNFHRAYGSECVHVAVLRNSMREKTKQNKNTRTQILHNKLITPVYVDPTHRYLLSLN